MCLPKWDMLKTSNLKAIQTYSFNTIFSISVTFWSYPNYLTFGYPNYLTFTSDYLDVNVMFIAKDGHKSNYLTFTISINVRVFESGGSMTII